MRGNKIGPQLVVNCRPWRKWAGSSCYTAESDSRTRPVAMIQTLTGDEADVVAYAQTPACASATSVSFFQGSAFTALSSLIWPRSNDFALTCTQN